MIKICIFANETLKINRDLNTNKAIGLLLIVTWLMAGMSCSNNVLSSRAQVMYDTTDLRSGDLLFRNGIGYESRVVTGLSDGKFSHIGIAYHDGRQWNVIHAVPGENEKGAPEYLKCEPISDFYCNTRAKLGGSARVGCTDSIANAIAESALRIVNRKVVFDNSYDINDTSELYCTELVRLVYLAQHIDLCEDRWHRIPIINTKTRVIFPEDIWNSPLLIKKSIF